MSASWPDREIGYPALETAARGPSLRRRLLLLVLASVLPLLVFVLSYQFHEYLVEIDATSRQTLALTRTMAQLVEAELEKRISALESLATAASLQSGDLTGFRGRAEIVLANQFPGANILVLGKDGRILMGTQFAEGTPLPVRPDVGSIGEVLTTGRPSISNLFYGATVRGSVVAIDVPVKNAQGEIIYVLSMNPRLETFADVLGRQKLTDGWVATVFDRNGVVIARVPNGEKFIGHQASVSFFAPLQASSEGIVESTSLEGVRMFSAFSHGERFGWAVGMGVPRADLTGPAWSVALGILSVGGATLAATLLMALYVARHIARPIQSLRRLAATPSREAVQHLLPTGLPEVDEVAGALLEAEERRRSSREAEALLRDGIESIPEGFSIYDADDRLVMCNESYRRLFEPYGIDLVVGKRYEDILREGVEKGRYPAAIGREEEWIADLVRRHRTAGQSSETQLADGTWILINKKRLSNGWIASLRVDITELKLVQQALSKSEERFRQVVESVSNGIVVTDVDGRIKMVNSTAEREFGYTRQELLDQPVELLVPERYRAEHPALRAAFAAAPRTRVMGAARDIYGRRKDGSEFPIEIGLSPIETEEGLMVLSAIVDITERVAAEADRRRTEQRLRDLQAELVHVSRLSTMGQMASTLAHELNQPLTAVTSYLQGLRRLVEGPTDPKRVVDVIDRTVAQAARAAQVIRRLRDFVSKGETDRELEDLNAVVKEAVELAMLGAGHAGVHVSLELDPSAGAVLIDKVQIQQVVVNLVRNAVEAMETSERRSVTVVTRALEENRGAEIHVIDTGPGISPEVADRLFKPFTTTKKTGMGVGLSICREIVEAHGGRISFAPHSPTGTKFTVRLPAPPPEEPENAVSTAGLYH